MRDILLFARVGVSVLGVLYIPAILGLLLHSFSERAARKQ